jgi:hypothetical protein
MTSEKYRGYLIEVRTIELPSEVGWRSLVNLEKHTGSEVFAWPTLPVPIIFPTDMEAQQAGLQHGKDMVDQKFG